MSWVAQPDGPTRLGPTMYFGPTGGAWARNIGPACELGWAWAKSLEVLLKARPNDLTTRWNFAQPGRAEPGLKILARQSSQAGPGPLCFVLGFSLAWPNMVRPENMLRYKCAWWWKWSLRAFTGPLAVVRAAAHGWAYNRSRALVMCMCPNKTINTYPSAVRSGYTMLFWIDLSNNLVHRHWRRP
jgi:hypothetical protein